MPRKRRIREQLPLYFTSNNSEAVLVSDITEGSEQSDIPELSRKKHKNEPLSSLGFSNDTAVASSSAPFIRQGTSGEPQRTLKLIITENHMLPDYIIMTVCIIDYTTLATELLDSSTADDLTALHVNPVVAELRPAAHVVLSSAGYAEQGHSDNAGQASYQRRRKASDVSVEYVDIGDMSNICIDCGAMFWLDESKRVPKNANPIYTQCCREGRIKIDNQKPTPAYLDYLLNPKNGPKSTHFRKNIRAYNTVFAFTSVGAKIDTVINNGSGPFVFKISGQIHHLMGTLLPPEGECPKFAQLYIYDTENELSNRQRVMDGLDPEIMQGLLDMFNDTNELVKFYRTVRHKYDDDTLRCLTLSILDNERVQDRQYDAPNSSEIAGLIAGDIGVYDSERDTIVENTNNTLQRVSKVHPKYMSFQYPIIFPYGENGYSINLQMLPPKDSRQIKRNKMSMRSFMSYQIQKRYNESNTMLKCGRLFQQFIVDAYASVEEDRLYYIRNNQGDFRVETYEGIYDSIARGDNNGQNIGRKVILPSTYTGSPRYMIKNYHDAMAICRRYGNPDLFITFTCNSKWPEIVRALENEFSPKSEDRPDIISRVFKLKHDDLIDFIRSGKPFGKVVADVATIEFQKRGLPHSHMLFWLNKKNKCYSSHDIDAIISAELPNRDANPILYHIVTQCMIHGPCGILNTKSPCMRNNNCTKHYPKDYVSETSFEMDKIPVYKRPDNDTKFTMKNGVKIDNRFIVPYNSELLLRYNAHINVESCSQSMLIKYLFKYISKGPDRARIEFHSNLNDEIQMYLNCRYISPPEAAWRLYEFPIHTRHPPVERLEVHLPYGQNIIFNQSQPLQSVVNNQGSKDTMLTAWFKANAEKDNLEARTLTYAEFPSKFVWNNSKKKWTPRNKGYAIGRLASVHPTSGELYYLRLLLNKQKGCKNFISIRTVSGVVYPTYQDACRALGLLGDDKEWAEALTNATLAASASELRHLFVTIILYCQVSNPNRLLDEHWRIMSDDILYNVQNKLSVPISNLPDFEVKNYLLFELQQLFINASSSLEEYGLPLPDEELMLELANKQLREELDYDRLTLEKEHATLITELNHDQKVIYNNVINAVYNKKNQLFFVYGHGGTGKTFLWHTIISKLRSEGKIVIAVASSGIASLLLPNGRTAHSRFKIPIDITDCSTCCIKKGTHLAKLIEKTDLIIWDEAPMTNRYCFESLDKSLRDILSKPNVRKNKLPFGGLPVVLGGDFRQILPVVDGGKAEVINASINNSKLWSLFQIYFLTQNMRLCKKGLTDEKKEKISEFAEWLLQVGDGNVSIARDPEDSDANWIDIPDDMLIDDYDNPISAIFLATYPHFLEKYTNFDYIRERAIITPKNVTVTEINNFIINLLPGKIVTYLSSDSICETNDNAENLKSLYPPEFLHEMEISGLPSHSLVLKKGMPIMLLRNLNQTYGLCNGTRLIVTDMFERVIEARVLTGTHVNHKFYLPRIILTGSDPRCPFVLKRRQFPVRPCYAMTINKSQGQSLKQVGLYLPQPVFTHGQLYVALSRVTSREGMKIIVTNDNMENKYTKNIVYKDVLQNITVSINQMRNDTHGR